MYDDYRLAFKILRTIYLHKSGDSDAALRLTGDKIIYLSEEPAISLNDEGGYCGSFKLEKHSIILAYNIFNWAKGIDKSVDGFYYMESDCPKLYSEIAFALGECKRSDKSLLIFGGQYRFISYRFYGLRFIRHKYNENFCDIYDAQSSYRICDARLTGHPIYLVNRVSREVIMYYMRRLFGKDEHFSSEFDSIDSAICG